MLKRLGISFWFVLAYALMQAHNLVPHHHNEEPVEQHHHQHQADNQVPHSHDDENEHETDHDSFPFSDANHNTDFGKIITKPGFLKDINWKSNIADVMLVSLYNKLTSFESAPIPHPPDDYARLHIIFLSHSLLLRAPPASSSLS